MKREKEYPVDKMCYNIYQELKEVTKQEICKNNYNKAIGFHDAVEINKQPDYFKMYKGKQMETDIVRRLMRTALNVKPGSYKVLKEGSIILKPDAWILENGQEIPVEIKSVPRNEHLPNNKQIPRKSYMQIQLYTRLAKTDYGYLIFEARDSGKLSIIFCRHNPQASEVVYSKLKKCEKDF